MRLKTTVSFVALAAVACATTAIAQQVKERYKPPVAELEDYQRDPMPAGIGGMGRCTTAAASRALGRPYVSLAKLVRCL